MPCSETNGICIFDEAGQLLYSNHGHSKIVGKRADDIVGRNWKDWTPKGQLSFATDRFEQSVAGRHVAFVRVIERADGTLVTGLAQLSRLRDRKKSVIIGAMRLLSFPHELLDAGPADTAIYVRDLAEQLQVIASEPSLSSLQNSLQAVAEEAGRAIERLASSKLG